MTETADRWLDLDVDPPAAVRRRDRFPAVLGAVAVIAALAGAGAASAGRDPAPPRPTPAAATLVLETAVLVPVPSARLRLRVENLGPDEQLIEDVVLSGAGIADTRTPIGRALPAGEALEFGLVAPLRCEPGAAVRGRVTASVHVVPRPRGPSTGPGAGDGGQERVSAVGLGAVGELGGVCTNADRSLPEGWATPARATAWQFAGSDLDLTVAGLPPDASRVMWVDADGVLLPQPQVAPEIGAGSVRLVLSPPAPGCRDGGVRAVVPSGLQLHLQTSAGLRTAYVPVGAALSQWLMDAFVRACPASPGGPPAVPPAG